MTHSKNPLVAMALACVLTLLLSHCSTKPKEESQTTQEQQPATPTTARPVHWGYEGEDGPGNWASLSPVYALCGNGQHQSPINIVKSDAKGGAVWKLDYKTTSLRIAHNEHMEDIIDNGHTIQITVDEGSTFTFNNKVYSLKQFHFHTPSEHTIDGQHAPMEMHMVHQSEDGSLAVVGILFQEGKEPNKNFEKIIANLPNAKGETKHITDVNLELQVHLPADNYAYHYTGSLTTPPCSENVQWLVLRDPVYLTAEQINAFASRIGPNNRPTQALNDRQVQVDDLVGKVSN
ncbi:MAG: carbonic anhydrase family protein [Cyclobacteriaceae bacterium]|nr:carbonic anhydrase family protein [Cyclobacteriaceae bacterium]MBX2956877.1 carbonic anhydrase family protein [Cyclobacteriaceae bacterium]